MHAHICGKKVVSSMIRKLGMSEEVFFEQLLFFLPTSAKFGSRLLHCTVLLRIKRLQQAAYSTELWYW